MNITIRAMEPGDWTVVREIYEQGIRTGMATFETDLPEWEEWDLAHRQDCRLVACREDNVVGWAALSPVSERCVYGGVGEVSVYVSEEARGEGVGGELLRSLVEQSERAGLWTLQAGIFPENSASIVLHQRNGFREVGTRERLGQLNGVWKDVLLFERRSEKVG